MNSIKILCAAYAALAYHPGSSGLPDWVAGQMEVSRTRILGNLNPDGQSPGTVIASPKRAGPDYYFHWVRDAALVYDTLATEYAKGTIHAAAAKQALLDYAAFSRTNQLADTRAGRERGLNSGEVKFHLNGEPFEGEWGRPQNDGPALRALTLTRFARELLRRGETDLARQLYDGKLPTESVIKADAEFTAAHYNETSYDLWEENHGHHFYTRINQYRSLIEVAQLAELLGDGGAAKYYREAAGILKDQLETHWDPSQGYIVQTVDPVYMLPEKKQNLDIAVVLGALHAYSPHAPKNETAIFGVTDPRVLASATLLVSQFRDGYKINRPKKTPQFVAPAVGRYVEDQWDGHERGGAGNPWILATNAIAELQYRVANSVEKSGNLLVSSETLLFLEQVSGLPEGVVRPEETLTETDPRFPVVLTALRTSADAHLARVRHHTQANGDFSEQIHRKRGSQQGPEHLTWSYASFRTAVWSGENWIFHRTDAK